MPITGAVAQHPSDLIGRSDLLSYKMSIFAHGVSFHGVYLVGHKSRPDCDTCMTGFPTPALDPLS